MKVKLKWIAIKNFKGIRELMIEFADETRIYAANGVGKTSILDAFLWLSFGKDSTGRTDFGIKPTNPDGSIIEKLDNDVEAGIEVDGREVKVRRVQREKWVTKRGQSEPEFKGHDVDYFWDDTPQKAGEFKNRIDSLMPENLFKLITNPLFFNSLDWKERRAALVSMVGEVSNDQVIDSMATLFNKQQTLDLVNLLNSGKALADWKREFALKKKKLQEELEKIPSRIDEATLAMPQEMDFSAIEKNIASLNMRVAVLDEAIEDKNKAFQVASKQLQEKQKTLHSLQMKKSEIAAQIRQREGEKVRYEESKINALKLDISKEQFQRQQLLKQVTAHEDEIKQSESEIAQLRKAWEQTNGDNRKWIEINSEEIRFDDHLFTCPTCRRALDAGDIELKKTEMRKNFAADKEKRLARVISDKQAELLRVSNEGKRKREDVEARNKRLSDIKEELSEADQRIDTRRRALDNAEKELAALQLETGPVEQIIEQDPEYLEVINNIAAVNSVVMEEPRIDTEALKAKRASLAAEIDTLKQQLNDRVAIERGKKRVEELKQQERDYANQKALLERQEYAIDVFNKTKIDLIESRVNEKFRLVKFRMFKEQINGGEQECCDALLNGVAFPDVNTAGKIAAGIDIINAFSRHHNRYAPIFIDSRESVTEIPSVDTQVISLIVSSEDKQFRIA